MKTPVSDGQSGADGARRPTAPRSITGSGHSVSRS